MEDEGEAQRSIYQAESGDDGDSKGDEMDSSGSSGDDAARGSADKDATIGSGGDEGEVDPDLAEFVLSPSDAGEEGSESEGEGRGGWGSSDSDADDSDEDVELTPEQIELRRLALKHAQEEDAATTADMVTGVIGFVLSLLVSGALPSFGVDHTHIMTAGMLGILSVIIYQSFFQKDPPAGERKSYAGAIFLVAAALGCMIGGMFGNVLKHYFKFNPRGLPAHSYW